MSKRIENAKALHGRLHKLHDPTDWTAAVESILGAILEELSAGPSISGEGLALLKAIRGATGRKQA